MQTSTACSDYIQTYNRDTKTLMQSLERIQRTSADILAALLATEPIAADGEEVVR